MGSRDFVDAMEVVEFSSAHGGLLSNQRNKENYRPMPMDPTSTPNAVKQILMTARGTNPQALFYESSFEGGLGIRLSPIKT